MFHNTQIKNDEFSTISNGQNLAFSQFRQAEMSILIKIALNFGGKIQM